MYSLKIVGFLFLLSLTFSLQTGTLANLPISYSCLSTTNFTNGSPYQGNLDKVIGQILLKTPPSGYSQASVGHHPDQTYGLGLCRGDVSSWACLECITKAQTEARKLCQGNKGAIIWYDECMVKYSEEDFLGQIDQSLAVYFINVKNVSESIGPFDMKKYMLLGQLSEEASASPRRYASGLIGLGHGNNTIYGLVQCTRDLSRSDCKKCIESEIEQLPRCCEGKQGARVLGGSCNVRYELYPFLNSN